MSLVMHTQLHELTCIHIVLTYFLFYKIIIYADIPRYFTKSRLKKVQPPPPANFVGTSEFGTCDCTDHLAKKLETDPMLLDIDPYLTPIQLQLEIGLRKLRKVLLIVFK